MRDRLRGRRGRYWDEIEKEKQEEAAGVVGNTTDNTTTTQKDQQASPDTSKAGNKDKLYQESTSKDRPPVFLLPGLASTRLVSWKHKPCPQSPLLSGIKMLDYVWLNMNFLIQMATIDARCWTECMTLGKYQSDYDGADEMEHETPSQEAKDSKSSKDDGKEEEYYGCKLRPDEGLDSISSLAPGSISSNLFVGGTNTVYAWLIQWLAGK